MLPGSCSLSFYCRSVWSFLPGARLFLHFLNLLHSLLYSYVGTLAVPTKYLTTSVRTFTLAVPPDWNTRSPDNCRCNSFTSFKSLLKCHSFLRSTLTTIFENCPDPSYCTPYLPSMIRQIFSMILIIFCHTI